MEMDYVKIDSVFVDDEGNRQIVPKILKLDNAIDSIDVIDFGTKYSTFRICRPEYDVDVDVETYKLDKTFDAIYDTLHTLIWDVEDDKETNVD
jgi:hypothetical protein